MQHKGTHGNEELVGHVDVLSDNGIGNIVLDGVQMIKCQHHQIAGVACH